VKERSRVKGAAKRQEMVITNRATNHGYREAGAEGAHQGGERKPLRLEPADCDPVAEIKWAAAATADLYRLAQIDDEAPALPELCVAIPERGGRGRLPDGRASCDLRRRSTGNSYTRRSLGSEPGRWKRVVLVVSLDKHCRGHMEPFGQGADLP
jgi:hypothetical protein